MKEERWCCVGTNFKEGPCYALESMRYSRSTSICAFIDGGDWTWRKWKAKGWKCVKVAIEITPIVKPIKNEKYTTTTATNS